MIMKEPIVRKVMVEYFKSKSIEVVHSQEKASGPDLILPQKKEVVEVKGSKYDFSKMLKQIVDYVKKWRQVGLALPFDGLTLEKAQIFYQLCNFIELVTENRLKLYVVVPEGKEQNVFYVKEFLDARIISTVVSMQQVPYYDLAHSPNSLDKMIERISAFSRLDTLAQTIINEGKTGWSEVSKISISD